MIDPAQAPLAFITGASSGIGQALAERCADAGYRLALVARRREPLLAWAQGAGLDEQRCRAYAADVRDRTAIVGAGRACLAEQGIPDVVIASAGISVGMDTAVEADLGTLADTLETNLLGLAATFHPFVEPMRRRGRGALVGVASVAAIRGLPGHGAYCASKAGVVSYCESLRLELRGTGVRVVTLVPGYIATPLTAGNRYNMPFLMQPADFASQALRTIEAGSSYRVIPWQMGVVAKLLRALPNPLYDRLLARRGRKARRDS
jgi:short-subunit dehydrogenase